MTVPEYFHFLARSWDITEARKITQSHEIRQSDMSSWFGWLGLIGIDPKHAATRDLTQPLIIAPVENATGGPNGFLIIDGWHRLAKAHTEGVTMLPVAVLTPAEERRCRVRDDTA